MHLFNENFRGGIFYGIEQPMSVYWLQRKVLALALALKAWSLLTSLVFSCVEVRLIFDVVVLLFCLRCVNLWLRNDDVRE